MAVCLEYQSVYQKRGREAVSYRLHILFAFSLLVILTSRVWMKIETTDLGYKLAREKQKTVALDMERRELQVELSILVRSDNLTKVARQRLGLLPLNPKQAWRVEY